MKTVPQQLWKPRWNKHSSVQNGSPVFNGGGNMKKIRITRSFYFAFACALLPALFCSGCSSKKNSPQTLQEQEDLIRVGFSQLGSESVWRSANSVSIQETLTAQNGYFLIYENARQKQENQIKAIRSFISQRVDFIVFSPVIEDGWDTVLSEAKQAGIPVITSDRQIRTDDESLVTAWVGGDMFTEGVMAASWLKENTDENETLNIAVLTGTTGSSAQIGRSEGFRSISDTMPGWNILEEKSGDFTMARGKEIMEEYLNKYDRIDVLVSQNDDMTFGAIEAIENAGLEPGKDILIISFDAVRDALVLVQEGKINVDVECSPLLGPYVDELIKAIHSGSEYSRNNPVEELVFTAENVDEYIDSRTY